MLDHLPEYVDPWRLASKDQVLRGRIGLAQFARLADILAKTEGHTAVDLCFSTGSGRRVIVEGSINAKLTLVCQRCLEPFLYGVDVTITLTLVENEAEFTRLPPGTEAVIVDKERCKLVELVEEELLLALPLIAMHEKDKCHSVLEGESATVSEATEEKRQNPFQVLRALKKSET